jgi:hypothetical protein
MGDDLPVTVERSEIHASEAWIQKAEDDPKQGFGNCLPCFAARSKRFFGSDFVYQQ